jgi:hypothetical protein
MAYRKLVARQINQNDMIWKLEEVICVDAVAVTAVAMVAVRNPALDLFEIKMVAI